MKRCAILIPSLNNRVDQWHNLLEILHTQIRKADAVGQFEIISNIDSGQKSIGQKRNELITQAVRGGFDYVMFFDDDDRPGKKYIEVNKAGIDSDSDVVALLGIYTTDGMNPVSFEHSIKYKAYKTNPDDIDVEIKYERYPNHLNCMKLSIAKQFPFPEIDHGEDTNFATQVFKSGLLKTEYTTNQFIYHYLYKTNK